jgi:hypothetical protein
LHQRETMFPIHIILIISIYWVKEALELISSNWIAKGEWLLRYSKHLGR